MMDEHRAAGDFPSAPWTAVPLRTDDGVALDGRLWPFADGCDTTVVVAHGFTGSQGLPDLLDVAARIWAAGYAVLTFDARGHGNSEGRCTLGQQEPLDVAAAVREARRSSSSVAVVGASMGALAALRYAAGSHHDLSALVLVSCPATWRLHSPQAALAAAMTKTSLGRRAVARLQRVRISRRWDPGDPPVETAPGVRCPTAVVHGARDRFIPVAEAHRLIRALRCPTRLDVVANATHAFQPALAGPVVDSLHWALEARHT
jgi:alpha-beta hydrolase superfamily lysophospholipase